VVATIGGTTLRALVCDVFGTVVDWRSSIVEQGRDFTEVTGAVVDWARFADAWREKYGPSMDRVRRGETPWQNLDALHRASLEELLVEFGVAGLSEEQKHDLTRVWHRLRPWPDAVPGLTRLRRAYIIAPLSNGNVALLTNMARHAGLPWDCILSAELARAYKPDPAVYRMAADLLDLRPEEVMMVAAHKGDLRAAAATGLRTGYVPRPLEWGPDRALDTTPDPSFDVVASDFEDLASKLGA
jgi:2-haloacid dehalogenase